MGNGDDLRICRIIGDFYRIPDQGRLGFIPLPTETDTGTFIHFPLLMMQESFGYNGCIQKSQWAAVPVPFLKR